MLATKTRMIAFCSAIFLPATLLNAQPGDPSSREHRNYHVQVRFETTHYLDGMAIETIVRIGEYWFHNQENPKFKYLHADEAGILQHSRLYKDGTSVALVQKKGNDEHATYQKSSDTLLQALSSILARPLFVWLCPSNRSAVGFHLREMKRNNSIPENNLSNGPIKLIFDSLWYVTKFDDDPKETGLNISTTYRVVNHSLEGFESVGLNKNQSKAFVVVAKILKFDTSPIDDSVFELRPTDRGTWMTDIQQKTMAIYRGDDDIREVKPGEFNGQNYQQLLNSDPPGKFNIKRNLFFLIVGMTIVTVIVWQVRARRLKIPKPSP
jgi:hypothetical protein